MATVVNTLCMPLPDTGFSTVVISMLSEGANMGEPDELQQRELAIHNLGERIEREIGRAIGRSPYPLGGVVTADGCCASPLPYMYCAFAYLIGKGSQTAGENLKEFHSNYAYCTGKTLGELFDADESECERLSGTCFSSGNELISQIIDDFIELCR